MSLDRDIRAVEHGGRSAIASIKRLMARTMEPFRLSKAVFRDENSELTPAAIAWLADLSRRNFGDRSTFDPDPRVHAFNEGRRAMLIDIMKQLRVDEARLARLTQQLKDVENG
ncbi:hypothetical protein ACMT1E_04360 [Sphingomonas flavalba]|uniref:Bbp19 family protein n=1 Tax=Sphingomonas flavalba TaxID=2559804 RepID=UPI0039DF9B26